MDPPNFSLDESKEYGKCYNLRNKKKLGSYCLGEIEGGSIHIEEKGKKEIIEA